MSKEHTKLRLEIGKFWPDPSRTGLLRAEITEVGELAILAHVFAPKERAAEQEGRDNARRLVAAWNACAGIETDVLESRAIEPCDICGASSHNLRANRAEARADAAEALLSDWLPSLQAVHDGEYHEYSGDVRLTEDQWTGISEAAAAFKAFLAETAPKPVRLGDEGEEMP